MGIIFLHVIECMKKPMIKYKITSVTLLLGLLDKVLYRSTLNYISMNMLIDALGVNLQNISGSYLDIIIYALI